MSNDKIYLPSSYSSNTNSNLFYFIAFSGINCFFVLVQFALDGGGNKGSKAILKALSIIAGIILARTGHVVSKHGLVLISIR